VLEHTLSEEERSQIVQTIEMFEVITQTQPDDYQSLEILKVDPLSDFGTPVEIVRLFGGKEAYMSAIRELQTELYREVA